jgi:hypothetical protein
LSLSTSGSVRQSSSPACMCSTVTLASFLGATVHRLNLLDDRVHVEIRHCSSSYRSCGMALVRLARRQRTSTSKAEASGTSMPISPHLTHRCTRMFCNSTTQGPGAIYGTVSCDKLTFPRHRRQASFWIGCGIAHAWSQRRHRRCTPQVLRSVVFTSLC